MKTCCGYSLEVPHQRASNEYPQHVFIEKIEKYLHFGWKKPYLEQWYMRQRSFLHHYFKMASWCTPTVAKTKKFLNLFILNFSFESFVSVPHGLVNS